MAECQVVAAYVVLSLRERVDEVTARGDSKLRNVQSAAGSTRQVYVLLAGLTRFPTRGAS